METINYCACVPNPVVNYRGLAIKECSDVYEPADDTFLLIDVLDKATIRKDERILEIGTGTGIIAISLARRGATVTAVDINPHAVECARENAARNNVNI